MSTSAAAHLVAVITGAGSGIGRATAIALSRLGYAVVLVGRREASLRETLAGSGSPNGLIHVADLGDPAAAAGVIAATMAKFGRVDVLVNNAGIGRAIPIAQTTIADVEEAWRVNTLGAAALILAAWPVFVRQHGQPLWSTRAGCIINVSSMASFDPFPGFFAYASSKAAMDLLTASAAKEGAAVGVRVFSVNPGAVETPMLRASFDEAMISRADTLDPAVVADVISACIRGDLDDRIGQRIPVLSHSAQAWYRDWSASHRMPTALPSGPAAPATA